MCFIVNPHLVHSWEVFCSLHGQIGRWPQLRMSRWANGQDAMQVQWRKSNVRTSKKATHWHKVHTKELYGPLAGTYHCRFSSTCTEKSKHIISILFCLNRLRIHIYINLSGRIHSKSQKLTLRTLRSLQFLGFLKYLVRAAYRAIV